MRANVEDAARSKSMMSIRTSGRARIPAISSGAQRRSKSAGANWQRSFRRLFEIAALTRPDGTPKRCHPHMFRDTFAVENFLAGVRID